MTELVLSWPGRPRTFCLPFPGKYFLLCICLYQLFSFLSIVAKPVAETTGGFRRFKLWALTVSGSAVKQSVMVLVVWGRADSSLNLTGTCWEWLLLCTDSEMELSTDLCPVQGHLSCLPDK